VRDDTDDGDRIRATAWNSALEVRQLRAFLAVVERGSLSAAATALGLAQSTVSEALASLDRAMGTPTIRRKRGTIATALTEAGEALLPHAKRVLREIDAAHRAVASVSSEARASIAIVANESVSTYLLAPSLAALRARWPNVRVAVTVGTCDGVRSAVASAHADVGLLLQEIGAPPSGHALATDTLSHDVRLVAFCGADHALARRAGRIARQEIAAFPLLIADAAGDFHELVHRYFEADGLPGPPLESAGTIEGVKRGVTGDRRALGLLPHYAVAGDLDGPMRALDLHPAPPRMQVVALRPVDRAADHPLVVELIRQLRSA
jgi:DNA-binding transcriptional LysR family regulator